MDKLQLGKKIIGQAAHEKIAEEIKKITTNLINSLTDKIGNKSSETLEHINGFQESALASIDKLKSSKENDMEALKSAYKQTADDIKESAGTLKQKLDPESLAIVGDEIDSYATNQYEFITNALSKLGTV